MKTRSTKKALLASLLSLVVCVSMLVGSTFAWFTDSVTSANNIIKSGNLDVELYYNNAETDDSVNGGWAKVNAQTNVFKQNTLWEPGHTEVVKFKVSNVGSLALKYKLGVNIVSEQSSFNVNNEEFHLSDYIYFGVVEGDQNYTRETAVAAVKDSAATIANSFSKFSSIEAGAADQVVTMVVYMPETVGNEANYRAGAPVPTIDLGVNLLATQFASETDSFDANYDATAELPGSGSAVLPANGSAVNVDIYSKKDKTDKIGSAMVPAGAIADPSKPVDVYVTESAYEANITVAANEKIATFNVEVTNLKANNNEPVKVTLNMPLGKDPATFKLYHYDTEIPCSYNPYDGLVTFESTSFSPFTVVYDAESVYVAPTVTPSDLPKADVQESPEYVNVDLEWGEFGQWSPTEGLDSQLEAAYTFKCTETADQAALNKFANWYCDFYVKLDRDLGENQIFLGGNYGSFGWVGFHNGDITLAANEEIGLLKSVTTNPWTYQDVASYVGEFICGVGDVDDALADATFTVMLRLTNPENENEFYNVATINHTFTKTVNSGEELQDAVNNGNQNITLGGDIDLNNGGIVIP